MDRWKDGASVSQSEKTKFISGQRAAHTHTLCIHLVMRNERDAKSGKMDEDEEEKEKNDEEEERRKATIRLCHWREGGKRRRRKKGCQR